MRTNVALDDSLIAEALQLSGLKTKKEVITTALQEVVEGKNRRNLLDIAGKIQFNEEYDYKALRQRK